MEIFKKDFYMRDLFNGVMEEFTMANLKMGKFMGLDNFQAHKESTKVNTNLV